MAKVYRLLRTILNTACEEGLLSSNPCQIKGAGVERSAERPIPTLAEVRLIADALPARHALIPWIAALGGLRKGEILGLARRHVSVELRTIRVERALQEITCTGAAFVSPKTTTSQRTVNIPERLATMIEGHLREFVADGPDALLFSNTAGRPIRATVWSTAWSDARAASGLDMLRLHDLRHLAGTLTAQAGATLKETMERLGHSSPDAAMRYQHVASERAAEVARRIDELLS